MTDGGGFKVYTAESTSRRTAVFEPVEIWLRGERDGSQKRLVLKVHQVDDPRTEGATLHAALEYQFRHKADEDWSESNFSLASLKAGEYVRMDLHADEVLKIFEELGRLYQATGVHVRYGRYAVAVPDPDMEIATMPKDAATRVRALLDAEGPAILETIAQLQPQWATWAALAEEHRQRAADLAEFEMHLAEEPPTWDATGRPAVALCG